jgi:hypothetical protein
VERGNLGRENDRANGAMAADPGRVTINDRRQLPMKLEEEGNFEKRLPVTQQSEGEFGTPKNEDRV